MRTIRTIMTNATLILGLCLAFAPVQIASGAGFWITGNITKTLVDQDNQFGGCMVHIDVELPAPCPASGWVSLDCAGHYYGVVNGNNKLSSVFTALSLNKQISLYVNDQFKNNNYCVARRVDILN